jgi:fused signal recognition particle receptor
MYRKASLLAVILALTTIAIGSYSHFVPSATLGSLPLLALHQYLAGGLAVLLLGLIAAAWSQSHCRTAAITLSTSSLLVLAGQIALGIGLIKLGNMPIVLVGHVLLPVILVGLLFRLYLRSQTTLQGQAPSLPGYFKAFTLVVRWLLIGQILLGAWYSANYGERACTTLPHCNPSWWPEAAYQQVLANIYSLLVPLLAGLMPTEFSAKETILPLHMLLAGVCWLAITVLTLIAWFSRVGKVIKWSATLLWLLFMVQLGLAMASLFIPAPTILVFYSALNVVAALLLLPLVAIKVYGRYAWLDAAQPLPAEFDVISSTVKPATPAIEAGVAYQPVEDVYIPASQASLYNRLKTQLKKTRSGLGGILANLPLGGKAINADLLEELEASLLTADVGIDVTSKIIKHLEETLERSQLKDGTVLTAALKQELLTILTPCSQPLHIVKKDGPFVILVVGVNGVGKTTTIGKLAKRLQAQGHSVMLAAGDTFRAAAVEQLQVWGERNNIHVVAQHTGADSASVIFDAVQSAQAKKVDILIADTAGRLHTKSNLMDELKKVKRIMGRLDDTAPHEVLLVLDAGTGQNALSQAKLFNETVALTGLVLTKLDGTAKGGVIFPLARQLGIPIRFIGIGEGIDDLQDFHAESFVDALFVKD